MLIHLDKCHSFFVVKAQFVVFKLFSRILRSLETMPIEVTEALAVYFLSHIFSEISESVFSRERKLIRVNIGGVRSMVLLTPIFAMLILDINVGVCKIAKQMPCWRSDYSSEIEGLYAILAQKNMKKR